MLLLGFALVEVVSLSTVSSILLSFIAVAVAVAASTAFAKAIGLEAWPGE